jgi:hypothetical protein
VAPGAGKFNDQDVMPHGTCSYPEMQVLDMQCTEYADAGYVVCSVQYAVWVCSVQCAVCSVQCGYAVCSVGMQCAVCSVQCAVWVCSVRCGYAVCSVGMQCAVCSVQCGYAVYSMGMQCAVWLCSFHLLLHSLHLLPHSLHQPKYGTFEYWARPCVLGPKDKERLDSAVKEEGAGTTCSEALIHPLLHPLIALVHPLIHTLMQSYTQFSRASLRRPHAFWYQSSAQEKRSQGESRRVRGGEESG